MSTLWRDNAGFIGSQSGPLIAHRGAGRKLRAFAVPSIQRQKEEADVRFRVGRRGFILSTGLIAAPFLHASAQASLRIGWLSVSPHPFVADFRERLRQLGYIEGENLVISTGMPMRMPPCCRQWSMN
jgi:hypothetical protein